uniref:uncharacterized protein LOC120808276 isoform X2 n=1 Tax=Gasterosteus aculeatus aculeatus TaxID=481459 RepID=UPI001A99ED7E|nr:uncharacterized protein LOC120808276 isoform X2 [Gasterosteus aculeatus aculeatus]XP_040017023.1 uncharacterized protein LOC120808276 isoform X2 [Gasterosteus aculeatus aculeatus]
MAEFRGIQTSLFLILMLQFTEAATEQRLTVRDGDEVTLPCNSVTEDQNNCDSTEWYFYHSGNRSTNYLVTKGQIDDEAKAESDRLSVSQNCSLVMKKVTRGDVGLYVCRQVRPGGHEDAKVHLSVVSMTEETNRDEVTLNCSVWTYEGCKHTVKWMNGGQDVDKDKEVKTSPSLCSASLSFMTSHFFYTSSFTSLKCEVTDGDKVMQFPLRNSPPCDITGEHTTTTTTEEDTKAGDTTSAIREASAEPQRGWRLVSVSVGLAALIIIVVVVNMWIRIKERKTQTEENAVRYDAEDDTVNYENMRPAAGV